MFLIEKGSRRYIYNEKEEDRYDQEICNPIDYKENTVQEWWN